MNGNQGWASVLRYRVLRNGIIIKFGVKSSIWHGIKGAHHKVMDNCIWQIGNGKKVNFWLDNWLGEPLVNIFNIHERYHRTLTSKVSDWWVNNSWKIHRNI